MDSSGYSLSHGRIWLSSSSQLTAKSAAMFAGVSSSSDVPGCPRLNDETTRTMPCPLPSTGNRLHTETPE